MTMGERMPLGRAPVTTTTTTTTTTVVEDEAVEAPVYRVQLQPRPHVTFDESVVDNEHLGRKKSNSGDMTIECCIFHKKRAFGESSSESGEDSDASEHKHPPHDKNCTHKHRRPKSQRPAKPHGFVPGDDEQHRHADDDGAQPDGAH